MNIIRSNSKGNPAIIDRINKIISAARVEISRWITFLEKAGTPEHLQPDYTDHA